MDQRNAQVVVITDQEELDPTQAFEKVAFFQSDGTPLDFSGIGEDGESAYEIAVNNGFVGTEEEWLTSLEGEDGADSTVPGPPGPPGIGAAGEDGLDGDSAYEVAVLEGFVGTEEEWLYSLIGPSVPQYEGGIAFRTDPLEKYFAALENVNTSPLNIVMFGDSTFCADSNVNDDEEQGRSWPSLVSDWLNKYIQSDPAPGYIHCSPTADGTVGPQVDTCTGTHISQGFANKAASIAGAQYIEHTFTDVDRITILYKKQPGSGDFRIRDGGASGTILATVNATNAVVTYSNMWTSDALTPGTHTIHILSLGGTHIIEGIYGYRNNYSKGIRVWPAVKAGATSNTSVGGLTNGYAQELIAAVDPDLVIYGTGINDDVNYNTYMRAQLDAYIPLSPNASHCLWIPYILPVSDRFTKTKVDIGRAIAVDYDLAVIDASIGIPDMSVNESDLLIDTTHPTREGRRRIASQVSLVLSGNPHGYLISKLDMGWERRFDVLKAYSNLDVIGTLDVTGAISSDTTVSSGTGTSKATLGSFGGVPLIQFRGDTSVLAPSTNLLTTLARIQHADSESLLDGVTRTQVNKAARTGAPKPTNAIAQNMDRNIVVGNVTAPVSGTLMVCAIPGLKGDIVASITFVSRTTPAAGLTNAWFVCINSSRVVLAVSADQGAMTWNANVPKVLAMVTPATLPSDGDYHFGIMMAGTTPASLSGLVIASSSLSGMAPITYGSSSTGLTTPPNVGDTMGAITVLGTGTPYCCFS